MRLIGLGYKFPCLRLLLEKVCADERFVSCPILHRARSKLDGSRFGPKSTLCSSTVTLVMRFNG